MSCTDEEQHNILAKPEQNFDPFSSQQATSVSHAMAMWVFNLELSDYKSGVPSKDAQDDDKEYSSEAVVSFVPARSGVEDEYLTSPRTAIACGRERTPSEIHSAIMSRPQCHHSIVLYLISLGFSICPSRSLESGVKLVSLSASPDRFCDASSEARVGVIGCQLFKRVLCVRGREDSAEPFSLTDSSIE
jgi:hypothetical protein